MKAKIDFQGTYLLIELIAETAEDAAKLIDYGYNAKQVKPDIFLNFGNGQVHASIYLGKKLPENQTHSMRPVKS